MSVWASRSQWAVAFAVGFADGDIAGKAEAEALAEERCEGELVIAGVARRLGGKDAGGRAVHIGGHVGF
jgi:hypothetical protein